MHFSLFKTSLLLHNQSNDATLPIQFGPRETPIWPDPCSPSCVISSRCDGGRHLSQIQIPPNPCKLSSIPSTELPKSRLDAQRERQSSRLMHVGEKGAVNKCPAGMPSLRHFFLKEKRGVRGDMRKSDSGSFLSFLHLQFNFAS